MRSAFAFIIVLFFSISLNAQVNQNPDNRFRLAQSYEQAGQLEKAEAIYRELADSQQWNNLYFESLNKVLVSQKKYKESIELINSKIKGTPNDYNFYGLLGTTYYIMDQPQEAYSAWEKGIAINPASFVSYRVIANYAIENRAFEKAIDFLKRGKQLSTDHAIFSIDLANIYAATMKFKEAAVEFCSLITQSPEQVQTAKSRITSYLSRPGAVEETIEAVKDFIVLKPQAELFDLLTFIYQSSGRYKEAFQNVIETEKKFPGKDGAVSGTNIFVFAQEAYRSRQYEWAAEAYNFIVKKFPNSPYISVAKIGYARTLEASLDQKFLEQNESWKPFAKPILLFTDEYKKIIDAYNEYGKGDPVNAVNIEALFRIAEIYRNRIFDFQKADSLYNLLSQFSPMTNYGIQSKIARGKIAITNNDLEQAKKFLEQALASMRIEPNDLSEINFYLARIEFWNGNFGSSIKLFKEAAKNLSTDFANDALELSAVINAAKKDSSNLLLYARADLLAVQNKYKQAASEFKILSGNPSLFVLNDFSKIKFAEMLIAENDLPAAVEILEEISENKKNEIFVEKSIFLLAQCFQYGIKDFQKAIQIYRKLLENFPNSLYFDRAREALQNLQTKNGLK
ncbi:MAG: tetratricopeptide repeat protein [Bacteroidota bacterium]